MSRADDIKALLESELSELIDPNGDYPILDDMPMSQRGNITKGQLLIKQIISKAMRGDQKTIQEVLDRVYGKTPQHIKQEIDVRSYTGFLESLAEIEDAEFTEDNPVITDGLDKLRDSGLM
jgi:hypothetical protein